jgi:hypothetical protein
MAKDFEVVRNLFAIIANDRTLYRVTKIVDPKHTLKITRTRPVDLREKNESYVLTVGVPNYVERIFIKDCIAAGETFPIKKAMLQHWPRKR